MLRPLGQGGMAQVYAAMHLPTQLEVAIKVLKPQRALDERWGRGLRREAQALAQLRHPHIASIIDFGAVDEGAARASRGALVLGGFWYAMELVCGQTLRRASWITSWDQVHELVLALLDALGHAHARGVIHRDLKPDNVMVSERDGALEVLKLLDFGIALGGELDAASSAPRAVVGTPAYMAPEQVQGELALQGPWTDLYALGCLVWRLVCGRAPFEAETTLETLKGHVFGALPALEPVLEVPDGLEGWFRQMLMKPATERVQTAAHAAQLWRRLHEVRLVRRPEAPRRAKLRVASAAALELQDQDRVKTQLVEGASAALADQTLVLSRAWPSQTQPTQDIAERALATGGEAGQWRPRGELRVPQEWGSAQEAIYRPPMWRQSAQLMAVRPPPLVGRALSRELLWQALRRVERLGQLELLTLLGPSGIGKTALARWFAQRAAELGAAQPLLMRHQPVPGPSDGLWGVIAQRYRVLWPQPRDAVEAHLAQALSCELPAALAQALAPALVDLALPRAQASWAQTQRALIDWLDALCARGPVLMIVDDLPWAHEAIDLIRALGARGAPGALLIVTTWATERVYEPSLGQTLSALEGELQACSVQLTRHELEPLARDQGAALCDELYPMPALARERVVDGSRGVPGELVRMVQLWAAEGALPEDSPTRDLALAPTPEELVMELLAALGQRVELARWHQVCEHAGAPWTPQDLERWCERGVLVLESDLATFASPAYAQRCRQRARAGARWRQHHALCMSALLMEQGDVDLASRDERAAHHAVEAGLDEQALELLHKAASRHYQRGHVSRAQSLLHRRAALIQSLDGSQLTERRVLNAMSTLHVTMMSWQREAAQALFEQVQAWMQQLPQPSDTLQTRWLYYKMRRAMSASEFAAMCALFESSALWAPASASAATSPSGWSLYACHSARLYAIALKHLWRLDEAWHASLRVLRAYGGLGEPHGQGLCRYMLGYLALALGELELAEQLAQQARQIFSTPELLNGRANVEFLLADVALARGLAEAAWGHLDQAQEVIEAAGPEERWLLSLNRAHLALWEERPEGARPHLDQARASLHQLNEHELLIFEMMELVLGAHDQRWGWLDEQANAWVERGERAGLLHADAPWALERMAALCLSACPELASRLHEAAARHRARVEATRVTARAALDARAMAQALWPIERLLHGEVLKADP